MDKKEVISFRKVIPAGTEDWLAERIKGDATIEEVRGRFYIGQQKSLQVSPYVERRGGSLQPLITFVKTSDHFLSGDDDNMVFPVSVSTQNDEYVKIHVKNIDPEHDYTLAFDIVVDYLGGKNRV